MQFAKINSPELRSIVQYIFGETYTAPLMGQGNKVGYGPCPMRGAVYVSPKMYCTILLSSGLLIFANCIRWYVNFYHDVAILLLLLYISQFLTQLHGGRPPFVFPICLGDATEGAKSGEGGGGIYPPPCLHAITSRPGSHRSQAPSLLFPKPHFFLPLPPFPGWSLCSRNLSTQQQQQQTFLRRFPFGGEIRRVPHR